ncbi:MAG TPA: hypothetical protein VKY59_04810, partial [Spirillospora sp.]|nr:hypothetical protein [Spirillospora sp.]
SFLAAHQWADDFVDKAIVDQGLNSRGYFHCAVIPLSGVFISPPVGFPVKNQSTRAALTSARSS